MEMLQSGNFAFMKLGEKIGFDHHHAGFYSPYAEMRSFTVSIVAGEISVNGVSDPTKVNGISSPTRVVGLDVNRRDCDNLRHSGDAGTNAQLAIWEDY
jgi:hypothetical protein